MEITIKMLYNDEGQETYARYVIAQFKRRLGPGPKKILNAGCGNNWMKKYAPAGWQIVGLDINNPSADIEANLDKKLPIKPSTYDGVIALHIVEHLHSPQTFFNESNRILKTGGIVYISTPSPWSNNAWEDPTHVRPYTVGAIKQLANDAQLYMEYGFYSTTAHGFALLGLNKLHGFYHWFTIKFHTLTVFNFFKGNTEVILRKR